MTQVVELVARVAQQGSLMPMSGRRRGIGGSHWTEGVGL